MFWAVIYNCETLALPGFQEGLCACNRFRSFQKHQLLVVGVPDTQPEPEVFSEEKGNSWKEEEDVISQNQWKE